jgi:peptide/nickel transport system ATP-binding protein
LSYTAHPPIDDTVLAANTVVPATTAPDILTVDNLTVSYAKGSTALNSASLSLTQGQRMAIVGESGSGKSTLAMAIAGFLRQSDVAMWSGEITFEGRTQGPLQNHQVPSRTPGISMVFQDAMTSLDPVWTVGSQLTAVLRAAKKASRRQASTVAEEWLRRVGLNDTHRVMRARPYELSGGMRQRVMIALALCASPRLLIADEPTSALDASLSRATMDLLLELTESTGVSLVIVSHDIHLCLEYADSVTVMYRGDIVEQGSSREVARDPQHPYTQGLLGCVPTLAQSSADRLPTLGDFFLAAGGAR